MLTVAEVTRVLEELVAAALSSDEVVRRRGEELLLGCSSGDWLFLDDHARGNAVRSAVVSGLSGCLSPWARDSSGFTAAVAGMHPDGRVRQRATQLLAGGRGRLRAAALAVRCLDHVPEVRADALAGLVGHTLPVEAEIALGVLTAAAGRSAASSVMARYTEHLVTDTTADVFRMLRISRDRNVRRWAFATGLARDLIEVEEIAAAAVGESDQLIRRWCVDWLGRHGDAAVLMRLLDGRFVDGRSAALQYLPDPRLTDARLSVPSSTLLHRFASSLSGGCAGGTWTPPRSTGPTSAGAAPAPAPLAWPGSPRSAPRWTASRCRTISTMTSRGSERPLSGR